METIKDTVARYKELAEIFLKNDTRAAIRDVDDTYYFCDILFVGEEKIRVQCFGPTSKAGLKFDIYWALIIKFEEYKEKVVG